MHRQPCFTKSVPPGSIRSFLRIFTFLGGRSHELLRLSPPNHAVLSSKHTSRLSVGAQLKPPVKYMATFINIPKDSHFPLQNLPYGVFKPRGAQAARVGVAIGESILDLAEISAAGCFQGSQVGSTQCFAQPTLNTFMSLGRVAWQETRAIIKSLLTGEDPRLETDPDLRERAIHPMSEAEILLPAQIGDYTDFYSSKYHAANVGALFRSRENALTENWLHVPIGYHGRASSVVVSGTPVVRPSGQVAPAPGSKAPTFQPSAMLDFELELAFFVGPGNELGKPVPIEKSRDHIFGFVLMNDWSARDLQRWEYVPLGPFLAKNFATSISPWVVTLEALEPFLCPAQPQDPQVLPYLREDIRVTYDIQLEVALKPERAAEATTISRTNFKHVYWTVDQQLAHHTVSGCNLRPGDLLASGTISGPDDGSLGSMLEMSEGGKKSVLLADGETRKSLHDGDEVSLTGYCQGPGYRVGFGSCSGTILPAYAFATKPT